MRREGGLWAMAAAVGLATTIGISTNQKVPSDTAKTVAQKNTRSQPRTPGQVTNPIEDGPCPDIEKLIQTFFLVKEDEIVAPDSCFPETKNGKPPSSTLLNKAKPMQFLIATVPDPLHTHFSLSFDRIIEAVQQGAQDENYSYNSSWLPWNLDDPSYALIDDQDTADKRKDRREDQPGFLLFRRQIPDTTGKPPENSPFGDGLLILVVGEEPTGGIHRRQFQNALAWIEALQPAPDAFSRIQILGPSFSGSLPSLVQLIREGKDGLKGRIGGRFRIFSGGVSSNAGVGWFNEATTAPDINGLNIEFRSFEHSGNLDLDRYCRYVSATSTDFSRLAIVSEDETAFGAEYNLGAADESPCRSPEGGSGPVHLYYPRDISALRAAYQSQSIFTRPTPSSTDTAPRKLQSDLADPEGKDHDTVRSYSGDQSALSQEAELLQIVSLLRSHNSQYILIRSSNPLDQLFLSHFFRMTYPAGRIIIVGADLLLRRETGISGLNGVMTLSTYPLLPWEQDWTLTRSSGTFHYHRAFPNDGTEGIYIAERFLMHQPQPAISPPGIQLSASARYEGEGNAFSNFVPAACDPGFSLPDYEAPFWMKREDAGGCRRPPTWLSVLGNGGFWPVAVLDYATDVGSDTPKAIDQLGEGEGMGQRLLHSVTSVGACIAFLIRGNAGHEPPSDPSHSWLSMPPSMKLLMIAGLLWAGFHALCCSRASLTAKPAHRAHFVYPRHISAQGQLGTIEESVERSFTQRQQKAHKVLILIGSLLVAILPIVLAWGCGEMWHGGDQVPNARVYRVVLVSIWLLAGFAVCANSWVEHSLYEPTDPDPLKQSFCEYLNGLFTSLSSVIKGRKIPSTVSSSFGWFFAVSIGLYWFLDFLLDKALNDTNRMSTYWRSINLTTGVSPLVPLLALTAGLYGWFWYSLQGMALMGEDRPQLPALKSLKIPPGKQEGKGASSHQVFGMLSREDAAQPIEELSLTFDPSVCWIGCLFLLTTLGIGWWIFGDPPIRNLGSREYSFGFCFCLCLCISILLANTWQMVRIWLRLRQMLHYLDRLPLRRTMLAMGGLSWGSVWKMGGTVLDTRYRVIFRQLESWTHLRSALEEKKSARGSLLGQVLMFDEDRKTELAAIQSCMSQIQATAKQRMEFAEWYSIHWDNWRARRLDPLKLLQLSLAHTTAVVLTQLLVPAWREEKQPINMSAAAQKDDEKEDQETPAADKLAPEIRNAEELVCLVYASFIQNTLGRIRALVLSIACIFLSITVAVSTYPFDPRALLSGTVIVLFMILGAAIVFIYIQMHRDATLSHLTGTKPGELGAEFWFKLVGLGVGPVLGLVTTVFPEFTDFIFSWVQPGLESLK